MKHITTIMIAISFGAMIIGCSTPKLTDTPTGDNCLKLTAKFNGISKTKYVCDTTACKKLMADLNNLK